MLNLFPHLLYPFYAITIVRITAAVILIVIGWRIYNMRHEIMASQIPLVGRPKVWMILTSAGVCALVGLFLFAGAYTQVAAILGALIALKHGVWWHRFKMILPLSRPAYVMLFFICVSLVFSGAGALGMDVPL